MNESRMQGIKRLFGSTDYLLLKTSHIAVVGIGGVGSWVAEALVRSNLGSITLIDLDEVCESNTNRQLHALDGNFGKSKIEVMKERLLKINPELQIKLIHDFINKDNIPQYISKDFHYVIDCIDSLQNKCYLADFCLKNQIPLMVIGGVGGKIDPLKIQVADLNKSFNDSLLYRMRKKLKRDFAFSREKKKEFGILCVFSPEDVRYLQKSGEITCHPNGENGKLDCESGLGTASFMTGTFAFIAVSQVIKDLFRLRSR